MKCLSGGVSQLIFLKLLGNFSLWSSCVIAAFFHSYHSNRLIQQVVLLPNFCHLLVLFQSLLILSITSFHQYSFSPNPISPHQFVGHVEQIQCSHFIHEAPETQEGSSSVVWLVNGGTIAGLFHFLCPPNPHTPGCCLIVPVELGLYLRVFLFCTPTLSSSPHPEAWPDGRREVPVLMVAPGSRAASFHWHPQPQTRYREGKKLRTTFHPSGAASRAIPYFHSSSVSCLDAVNLGDVGSQEWR